MANRTRWEQVTNKLKRRLFINSNFSLMDVFDTITLREPNFRLEKSLIECIKINPNLKLTDYWYWTPETDHRMTEQLFEVKNEWVYEICLLEESLVKIVVITSEDHFKRDSKFP